MTGLLLRQKVGGESERRRGSQLSAILEFTWVPLQTGAGTLATIGFPSITASLTFAKSARLRNYQTTQIVHIFSLAHADHMLDTWPAWVQACLPSQKLLGGI